jgi:hypothetical protein
MDSTDVNQNFGGIVEGVHIASYSLERALRTLEWLLVDDRWKLVGDGFDDIHTFIDAVKLGDNFKLIAEQRKKIAERIKKLQPTVSNRQIAKVVGVSEATSRRDAASNDAPADKKARKPKAPKAPPASNDATPKPADDTDDSPEGVEDHIDRENPENYRAAFLLRADQAAHFASYSGPKKFNKSLLDPARKVVAAWTAIVEQLEREDA